MNKKIKHNIILSIIFIILTIICFAEPSCKNIFDKQFMQSLNPDPNKPFGIKSAAYIDDVFYIYLGDTIYTLTLDDTNPTPYCILPQNPGWDNIRNDVPLEALPESERTQFEQAVEYIAAGDDVLWGYNLISGKIGKIDKNGINWLPATLNTADFFEDGLFTIRYYMPQKSFVVNNNLYIFGENSGAKNFPHGMVLLCFDLDNGNYKLIDTKNTRSICAYKKDKILLAYGGSKKHMELGVLDLNTGNTENLPLTIPFPDRSDEYLSNIGCLAYNEQENRINFAFGETPLACEVWQSINGNAFNPVLHINAFAGESFEGWALPNYIYVFYNVEDGLYVCSLN
ncbi:MAG: hypothetical protein ACOYIT_06505 [Christensenellales bacterium]|jgi:hypothetical protein